jgi:hypothetical protein
LYVVKNRLVRRLLAGFPIMAHTKAPSSDDVTSLIGK